MTVPARDQTHSGKTKSVSTPHSERREVSHAGPVLLFTAEDVVRMGAELFLQKWYTAATTLNLRSF